MSRHSEDQKKFWGLPVPDGLVHGSGSRAATVYGCDCKVCLPSGRRNRPRGQAKTVQERQRASRAKLFGTPVPEGNKHGLYAYRTYGCPCEVCRTARRESRERGEARKAAAWRGHWQEREDGVTVVHWPPANRPWLCPECDFKKIEEA